MYFMLFSIGTNHGIGIALYALSKMAASGIPSLANYSVIQLPGAIPMRVSKFKAALFAAAAVGVLASSGARAADSVSVTVNATVVGACKFFTAAPVVNITNTGVGSNIDPSSATTATGNVP